MLRNRVAGLAAAAVGVVAVLTVFHPPQWPWQRVFHFRIASPAFSQLTPGTSVDLAGKRVGQVQSLTVAHGLPMLNVEIDGSDAHLLHADTSASIQPHGLLGTQFIQLSGGSQGRLAEGGIIPASRVHVAVTLDQVLNVFQTTERQNLQTLIVELGKASAGRGADMHQTLRSLSDASNSLSQVTSTLHHHDQGLNSIISSSEQVNRSLQNAPLAAQIRDTNQVLSGVSKVDTSLGNGVDHTAAVLSDLDLVLRGNTGNLRYTFRKSPQVLAQLRTLLSEGGVLLKGINPSLPALMASVVEAESAFGGHDANGHFVRVMSVLGTCTLNLNTGCSGGPGAGGPPVTVPGTSKVPVPGPSSSISDRGLMKLLTGGH
ncbi:MAG: MCE family protein [Actinobacteria bacterium]|nr:MCE family protein [Actinomycetota bacterium]